jgi:hypothetical protein
MKRMLLGAVLLIAITAVTVTLTVRPPASAPRNVVQTRLYPFWNEAGEVQGYLTPSISAP